MEGFWHGMEMKWKKIASMEYGKIVFHSFSYHALPPLWQTYGMTHGRWSFVLRLFMNLSFTHWKVKGLIVISGVA